MDDGENVFMPDSLRGRYRLSRRGQVAFAASLVCLIFVLAASFGAPRASATTWSLDSPAANSSFYNDEDEVLFKWNVSDYDIGWWLEIFRADGSTLLRSREELSVEWVRMALLTPGTYTWRVCADNLGTDGPCAGPRPFTVLGEPELDRFIAVAEMKAKLRRTWHARWSKVRCVDDGESFFNCTMRWRSKRVNYQGQGSVYVQKHKYVVNAYVFSRVRR
jgi:hypothetical protein